MYTLFPYIHTVSKTTKVIFRQCSGGKLTNNMAKYERKDSSKQEDVIQLIDPNDTKFKLGPGSLKMAAIVKINRMISQGCLCNQSLSKYIPKSLVEYIESVKVGKGDLYESGLLQKFMKSIGYPCVIGGGYSTFMMGDTSTHTDVDFFTVLPTSSSFNSIIKRILATQKFELSKHQWHPYKQMGNRIFDVYSFQVIRQPEDIDSSFSDHLLYHFQLIIQIVESSETAHEILDDSLKLAKYVTDGFDLNICKTVGVRWTEDELIFFRTHPYQQITYSMVTELEPFILNLYSEQGVIESLRILERFKNLGMDDAARKLIELQENYNYKFILNEGDLSWFNFIGQLNSFCRRIKEYFYRQTFQPDLIGKHF